MAPGALAQANQDMLPSERQTQRALSAKTVCTIKRATCEPPGLIAEVLDGPPLPKPGTHPRRRDS